MLVTKLVIVFTWQPTQEEYLLKVVHFLESSEKTSEYTNQLCWKRYIQDFMKIEFHIPCSGEKVVNVLAEQFYRVLKSEQIVFERFLRFHASVTVRHLSITRLLPTLFKLQSYGLEEISSKMNVIETENISERLSSVFTDTLFDILKNLFETDQSDNSVETFKEWHELFFHSVS